MNPESTLSPDMPTPRASATHSGTQQIVKDNRATPSLGISNDIHRIGCHQASVDIRESAREKAAVLLSLIDCMSRNTLPRLVETERDVASQA